jgi:hypothetical protein
MTLITIINNDLHTLIPIIFEFKNKIKKHILVYDEAKLEKSLVKKLKKGIQKVNVYYNLKQDIELIEVDEDNKKDMIQLQQSLKLVSDNLYLNAAQSDIALVVILSGYILQHNGIVLSYDKYDNTYNEIRQDGFTNHNIKHNLKLDDYFSFMGYKKISSKDPNEFEGKESHINYLFKTPQKLFLSTLLIRKQKIKYLDLASRNALLALGIIDKKLNFTKKKGFGELFEEFIYLKLKRYNFDDIQMSVEIIFDEQLGVLNEFDIIAIKNNHITIIECKWGSLFSANDIIYKLDSILENFGDDSKGLIVNIQQNYDPTYDNERVLKKVFSKSSYSRATYNNLEIYSDYLYNDLLFSELVEDFIGVELLNDKYAKNEIVFLLGGYDLEMVEIKNILQQHSKHYIDKKLSWGAKLSSYKDVLNDTTIYYGIELIEDIEPPKNYITIDHHNDNQNKKSSIEQVADLLHIKLSRYQQLVALNDSGYIPAMQKYGATEVEIDYIRQKDRKIQGATQEDEILAKISIENATKKNQIFIIEAQTSIFSTITDRLYGKEENILLYNDNKLVYYGKNIQKLIKQFQKDIQKQKMYYGGNFGFFGISEGKYSYEQIIKIKNKILDIVS